jgi:hypothetical protein
MKALMHPFAGVRALEIGLAVGDTTWFEETLIPHNLGETISMRASLS